MLSNLKQKTTHLSQKFNKRLLKKGLMKRKWSSSRTLGDLLAFHFFRFSSLFMIRACSIDDQKIIFAEQAHCSRKISKMVSYWRQAGLRYELLLFLLKNYPTRNNSEPSGWLLVFFVVNTRELSIICVKFHMYDIVARNVH